MVPEDRRGWSSGTTTDDGRPPSIGIPSIAPQEVPVSRSLSPVALSVGVLYAVLGGLELAFGQATVFASPTDHVIEWLFVAVLALGALLLVRAARESDARVTSVAFLVTAVGHTAMGVAALATAVAGRESLDALFPLGVLLTLCGLVALAVQDLRKRVLPPHVGVVLAVAFVLAIPAGALIDVGSLVLAAGWLATARLLGAAREDAPVLAA
jgi:hypothetical protein